MNNKSKYFSFFYLGLMILILPLIYFGKSLDPVLLPRVIALSIILCIILILVALKVAANSGRFSFAALRNRIFHVFLLYVIFSLVALAGAINLSEGIFEISKIVLGLAVLITSALVFKNYSDSRSLLAKFMIACGLMLALIGAGQYSGIAFTFFQAHGLPSGTSVNRNLFMALLAIIIPYAFYGSLHLSRIWKFISMTAGLLMLILIIIGSSRSVWVACIFASIISLALYFAYFRGKVEMRVSAKKQKSRLAVLAISVVVVLLISGSFFITNSRGINIFSRAASIFNPDYPSNYTRVELWKKSISIFADHPLFGVGPGNWKINIGKYGPIGSPGIAKSRFFQRPHNDFLWVLSEQGFPGLLTYLGIFAMAIFYALRIIVKTPPGQNKQRHFALFMLWGVIVYLTDSFFSFPMERMLNFTFIIFMIAAIVSLYEDTRLSTRKDMSKGGKYAVIIPLIVMVAFAGIIGYIRLKSEVHAKIAMTYREKNDWINVIKEINVAESGMGNLDPTSAPLAWYSGEAHFMLKEYDLAFEDYLRAYKYNPNHLHVLNNLGTCFEIRGEHNKAIEMFERALVANPDFNETLINLAAVYYNIGQFEKANETISRVATDCPDPRYSLFMQKINEKLK